LTAAVWLGVLASVAMAQSGPPTGDVPARLKAVEELKIQIQDATAATTADASGRVAPDREQLIDQAIELRRGLIPELPPGSAERLKLTYEQSAALLARLARDGADTSVLVGLADDERLASVKAAADEVASLLEPLPREKAPIRELLLRGRLGLVQARLDASSPLAKQASRPRGARVPRCRAGGAGGPGADAGGRAGRGRWLPPRGHGAGDPLRWEQGRAQGRVATPRRSPPPSRTRRGSRSRRRGSSLDSPRPRRSPRAARAHRCPRLPRNAARP
jgi:hypothetical protein